MLREDWLIDPIPAGGELYSELENRIAQADVFLAFVDKNIATKSPLKSSN
jgi:hypothetical protein